MTLSHVFFGQSARHCYASGRISDCEVFVILMNERDFWSGQPDSNWRPSAWQADALPTELYPQLKLHHKSVMFFGGRIIVL